MLSAKWSRKFIDEAFIPVIIKILRPEDFLFHRCSIDYVISIISCRSYFVSVYLFQFWGMLNKTVIPRVIYFIIDEISVCVNINFIRPFHGYLEDNFKTEFDIFPSVKFIFILRVRTHFMVFCDNCAYICYDAMVTDT